MGSSSISDFLSSVTLAVTVAASGADNLSTEVDLFETF